MSNINPRHTGTTIFDLLEEIIGPEAVYAWRSRINWSPLVRNWRLLHDLAPGQDHRIEAPPVDPLLLYEGVECWQVLQEGTDYWVRELSGERVLTTTCYHQLTADMGDRPFDVPLLGKGRLSGGWDQEIIYFVQAKFESPVTMEQFNLFFQDLSQRGYQFVDPRPEHLGIYQGRVVLLVPWIVCFPRPISDVLREITEEKLLESHTVVNYAAVFKQSPLRANRVILRPTYSVILELEGGDLLNMTENFRLFDEMGQRPFDVPILKKGSLPNPYGHDIQYFIHPPVQSPVTLEQAVEFNDAVKKLGYRYPFVRREQLGIYDGKVVLLDPWAVNKY